MEPTKTTVILDLGLFEIDSIIDREITVCLGGSIYLKAYLPSGIEARQRTLVKLTVELPRAKPL